MAKARPVALSRLPLERVGWMGTDGQTAYLFCIFHEEKTPSLRVWADGGWRCFSCGAFGQLKDHDKIREKYKALQQAWRTRYGDPTCAS